MFSVQLRIVETADGTLLSVLVNREGVFLYLCPVELALLWPWFTP